MNTIKLNRGQEAMNRIQKLWIKSQLESLEKMEKRSNYLEGYKRALEHIKELGEDKND